MPEVLRIKAFLCLERNATRDYLDLAALAAHMGIHAAAEALGRMDELYPQKSGDGWAVRTQLIMQLAAPPPFDLDTLDLAEYKGVRPPFDRWEHVVDVCGEVSDQLLSACLAALRSDASPSAQEARVSLDQWSVSRLTNDPEPGRDL
jgi:hypothetical protein